MKHFQDLNQKGLDIITDLLGQTLVEIYKNILVDGELLCPKCYHMIVIKMCEKFIAQYTPEDNKNVH